MTPDDLKDFFVASAGVAGALVGLLFVAISVTQDRLIERADTQLHRVRAAAALTSFTNALAVSLFGLVPGEKLGTTALWTGILGALFVLGSLLSLFRVRRFRWSDLRDELFLAGLAVVFGLQITNGIGLIDRPDDRGSANTLAVLVVVCFLIGIARAWELIGGPRIGLRSELVKQVRDRNEDS